MEDNLREKLAELEHNQWWRWAKWMAQNETVSPERLQRWEENCFKPYNELTEHEKDKDRLQADLVIDFLKEHDLI
jgi:hypothetical protein